MGRESYVYLLRERFIIEYRIPLEIYNLSGYFKGPSSGEERVTSPSDRFIFKHTRLSYVILN